MNKAFIIGNYFAPNRLLVERKRQAKVKQGAAKIDGEKVSDRHLVLRPGFTGMPQIGKRKFARLAPSQLEMQPDGQGVALSIAGS